MPRVHAQKTGDEMKNLKRLMKDLWKVAGFRLILVAIFIVITALSNTLVSVFLEPIINKISAR